MAAKRIAALAIGTAALAVSALYIAVTFQWRAALETLFTARPAWFLLGGSAAVLGYWMTRALRWSYLMRGMQSTPRFLDLYLCSSVALGLSVRQAEALAARSGVTRRRKTIPAVDKDSDTRALERDLARLLGLTVEITHGAAGGSVIIRYATLEQLDDVIRRLNPSFS